MLKNPNYKYGPQDYLVPGHLNISTYILDKLWRYKDQVALINAMTQESVTYGEICQQAMNFAISLQRIGVRKGDVIGILSENRNEYCGAFIGATSVGAVVTTISTSYVAGELVHVMKISKPKYMICSPFTYKAHEKTLKSLRFTKIIMFGEKVPKFVFSYNNMAIKVDNVDYEKFEAVDVDGQTDTMLIVYSSGTTGLPKGVMLTHLNVITSCCFPPSTDASAATLIINPWYHVMGLMAIIRSLPLARTSVYLPKFDVDAYLKAIEKYKIAQLILVPPILVAVCKASSKYDLSSVRMIYSGAAPLHKDSCKDVYNTFPNLKYILQGYGSSECTLGVTQFYFDELRDAKENISLTKPASVGRVVPGCVIKIVDTETRKPLGPNQQGEICVKGPLLMKGYVGIGRGSDFDEEGFYKTGDVGYYDEDGYFYIADRLKELIKYKGYQVPPAELESVLLTHPAVKDAAVIGIPHKSGGEVPLAFIVQASDVTGDEIKKFVEERLSNPKHLRGGVRFVSAIPKLPSGKILRKDLRKMVKAGKSKL